jgi:hypothetical protein
MKPQSPVREAHSPEPSRDAIEMNSEDSFPASDAPELDAIQADRMSEIVDHRA